MRRRKKKNPLPKLKTKLRDALELVEIITNNAFKDAQKGEHRAGTYHPLWDTPVIDEQMAIDAGYDPALFTPLNIVAHSVEPKVADQLLNLLLNDPEELEDKSGFYRKIVDQLESDTSDIYDWEKGAIPQSWTTRRKRFGGVEMPSPLEEGYSQLSEFYTQQNLPRPSSYNEFEDRLSLKKRTPKRRT